MTQRLFWKDSNTVGRLQRHLRDGKAVISSTDTVFGLLTDTSKQGFDTLNVIKKRAKKPYLILIGSKKQALSFICTPILLQIEKIMESCWPGPVTLICKARNDLPDYMRSQQGTVGLRMPDHEGLLKLLGCFDGLFSTSANLSGKPVPLTVDELDEQILNQVEYLVLDEEKDMPVGALPSTILDCSQQISVIREGAFPIKEIEARAGITIKK
ncbi:MAG: L-threonylcarbamoyladenylate synthase [bacterium]|nr:L-threonylcarbamoyladenylate synthase [bacterium]